MALESPTFELSPGDPFPEGLDVVTMFHGSEDESLEATRPEDTWRAPDGTYPYDGLHLYERVVGTIGKLDASGNRLPNVFEHHLERPVITQLYAEEQNAAAIAEGRVTIYMDPESDYFKRKREEYLLELRETHHQSLIERGISPTEFPRRYKAGDFSTRVGGVVLGYINLEVIDVQLVEAGLEDPRILDPEKYTYDPDTKRAIRKRWPIPGSPEDVAK